MKGPIGLLGEYKLTKRKMSEVVMQTVELSSTQDATEWMFKTINITYAKSNLKQVADNATQPNDEEITLLLSLLEDFEDLFDGTLGDWATEPVNLELNPVSKQFNSRYYPVPRINKGKIHK